MKYTKLTIKKLCHSRLDRESSAGTKFCNWIPAFAGMTVILLWLFLPKSVSALTCNDQADGNWNSAGTWSCGVVPDSDDAVTIDSHTVTMTANQAALSVAISGGTLNMGSYTLTLASSGGWAYTSGTVDAGTSTLKFTGYGSTFTPGSVEYYNIDCAKAANHFLTISGTAKVTNNLIWTAGRIDSGTVDLYGDLVPIAPGYDNRGGSGTVNFVGDGNQNMNFSGVSGYIANVSINKPSGTLYLSGIIVLGSEANWTYISGAMDAGTSTLKFTVYGSTFTPGLVEYYNVELNKAVNNDLNLYGELNISNELKITNGDFLNTSGNYTITTKDFVQTGGTISMGSSAMKVTGNFTRTGGTFTQGTSTVAFQGSNQTISGSTTFYRLYKLINEADTLTITAGNTIVIAASGVMRFWGKPEGETLSIVSSSPGTPYTITRTGTAELEYTNWSDASWSAATVAAASTLGTGNTNLTVTKEFISTIRATSGDYSTLSGWESAVNCDLTAATTKVFSHGGITGTIADNSAVSGETSGATATAVHTTSTQILLKSIAVSTFQSGEKVWLDSDHNNYVILSDAGYGAIASAYPYNDWPSGLAGLVLIDGWTANSTNYVKIYAPAGERHNGIPKSGGNYTGFALKANASYTLSGALDIRESYTVVDGIIVDGNAQGGQDSISIFSADIVARINHCIVMGAAGGRHGVEFEAGTGNSVVANTLALDNGGNGFSAFGGGRFYNCTARDNGGAGFNKINQAGTPYAKNCLAEGNAGGDFVIGSGRTFDINYCASADATADDQGGAGNRIDQTFTFKDETNDDFHLMTGDGGARDHGTDLSVDPNYPIIDDIDGESRLELDPNGWDIGADEFIPTIAETMGGTADSSDPPIAYWKFNEGYGGTAYNSGSASGIDGTLQSGGSGTNDTNTKMWDKNGKFATAMEFDGTNDDVDVGDIGEINSVSFWVKVDSTTEKIIQLAPAAWACGDTLTYCGDNYTTAQMTETYGSQCWLGENLRVTTKPDCVTGITSYCNPSGCASPWGRLYDWTTMMNGATTATGCGAKIQGICPDGWHIPSDYSGCSGDDFPGLGADGGALKDTGIPPWTLPNTGATNVSGWTGYPAGLYFSGSYYSRGFNGYFWSSAQYDASNAWYRYLNFDNAAFSQNYFDKPAGISVRCLKDSGGGGAGTSIEVSSGTLSATGFTSPTIYVDGEESSTLAAGDWHHVIITSDTAVDATDAIIGQIDGEYFSGLIDEVKIYDYALSVNQVKREYNQGAAMVMGGTGTDSATGNPTMAGSGAYCVPGATDYCAAPVGEWNMEQRVSGAGQTLYDTSGNGNDGTTYSANGTGMDCTNNGKVGLGCEFDGVDDYVDISNEGHFDGYGAMSWCLWSYPRSDNDTPIALTKTSYDSTWSSFRITNNHLAVRTTNNGWYTAGTTVSRGEVFLNEWNFTCYTYDGSNLRAYSNGVLINVSSPSISGSIYDSTVTVKIGWKDAVSTSYYDGLVDQVRIYDYARTPAQIAWEYNQGASVAQWKMNEGTGTATTYNAVANTLHGAMNNFEEGDWVSGKFGTALDFDGSNEYVSIGDTNLNINTVSFWINADGATDDIIDLDGGAHTVTVSGGTLTAGGFDAPTIYVDGLAGATLGASVWHHVLIKTDTAFEASNLNLGKINTGYFAGQLDDVRLYNYALTPLQIRQLYNEGSSVRF